MTQLEVAVESLNASLEAAWCRLTELRNGAKAWAYVSPAGRVFCRLERLPDPLGVEVGQFGAGVSLADFRAAVFRGFEGMRRRA